MVKTRLIFTLYTIYGILFKGESCARVRARGVCVFGRGRVMWQNAVRSTHAFTRGAVLPGGEVCVCVCACTRVYRARVKELGKIRERGGGCACVRVCVCHGSYYSGTREILFAQLWAQAGLDPPPPNTVARLLCRTTPCSAREGSSNFVFVFLNDTPQPEPRGSTRAQSETRARLRFSFHSSCFSSRSGVCA